MSVTEGLGEEFGYGLLFPDWIDLAAPVAGANKSFTVPGEFYVRVIAAMATLSTDATVANRLLALDFIDGRGITRMRNAPAVVWTANTSAQAFVWSHTQTQAEWNANAPAIVPVLDAFLPPSFVIQFTLDNKQAGDQLSGLKLWVEKYPSGPRGYPQGMVGLEPRAAGRRRRR